MARAGPLTVLLGMTVGAPLQSWMGAGHPSVISSRPNSSPPFPDHPSPAPLTSTPAQSASRVLSTLLLKAAGNAAHHISTSVLASSAGERGPWTVSVRSASGGAQHLPAQRISVEPRSPDLSGLAGTAFLSPFPDGGAGSGSAPLSATARRA
jgi:hypothetical protein